METEMAAGARAGIRLTIADRFLALGCEVALANRSRWPFPERQAAGMMRQQMGLPMSSRAGNLDWPARIDSDAVDRVVPARDEHLTPEQRHLAIDAAGGRRPVGACFGQFRALARLTR